MSLVDNDSGETRAAGDKRCDEDMWRCGRRLALEAVGVIAALACIRVLLYPKEEPLLMRQSVLFACLYVGLGMAFKLCRFDFSDKIQSIVGIELGLKMVRAL